ncbi:DUF1617 family protein [Clostridium guangxiense]|uniref:DUF1617 family protein n=1 Tax=Clostridium guangxiense TaxID=1662055 RepID=UPI001E3A7391|nr:DUF1617 family protein [Clostridium guangxiense]MCD2348480.1 DUF1617 family protein [Clostridium guangxiense]
MKITNREILESINTLKVVAQKQMPVKVSYAIAKNISKIDAELKIYEKERKKLIDKYAEKDKDNKIISNKEGQIKFKDQTAWDKDIEELLSIETDIEIHKFKFDLLNGVQMSPAELQAIDYMIEE